MTHTRPWCLEQHGTNHNSLGWPRTCRDRFRHLRINRDGLEWLGPSRDGLSCSIMRIVSDYLYPEGVVLKGLVPPDCLEQIECSRDKLEWLGINRDSYGRSGAIWDSLQYLRACRDDFRCYRPNRDCLRWLWPKRTVWEDLVKPGERVWHELGQIGLNGVTWDQ